jgi:hypothetical protein
LRAAEALYAFGISRRDTVDDFNWKESFKRIKRLRNEAALVLHHDAITGTSRTTVVRDYLQRLTQGSNEVQQVSTDMLKILLTPFGKKTNLQLTNSFTSAMYTLSLQQLKGNLVYPIVIQNSLAWERHDVVSVSL